MKCKYLRLAPNRQAREVGCPLDHCACGTHDIEHKCKVYDEDIYEAEIKAGWSRGE